MRKIKIYFLSIIASLSLILTLGVINNTNNSFAYSTTDNGIEYYISDGQVIICGYSGNDPELDIPSKIDGCPVTTIDKYAFQYRKDLTSIKLPDSVTSIGWESFNECSNLKNIKLSSKLKTIGYRAFHNCKNLENLTMPSSITSIGKSAFYNCEHLSNLIIPNSVTSIGEYAFANCFRLTNIKLPDKLKVIDSSTFENCTNIESIEIPDTVEEIGSSVFYGCISLKNIKINSPSISIGNYAFSDCTNLESIILPEGLESIEESTFAGCSSLKSIELSKNLSSIKSNAFYECSSLKDVNLPESLTSIDDNSFYGCISLESITIPSNVKYIAENTFENCTSLYIIVVHENTYSYRVISKYYPDKVRIFGYPSKITISNENYPLNIIYKNKFKLTGNIKSDYKLSSITAQIIDTSNNTISKISKTVSPDSFTYSIENLQIKFETLPVGNYKYKLIASDEKGVSKTLINKNFKVVKPNIPVNNVTGFKYTSSTSNTKLYWNKANGVSGYEIWMYNSKTRKYEKIKTIKNASTLSYTKSKLSSSTIYKYKIRAYKIVNDDKYYGSFSKVLTTATKPPTPSITLKSTTKGKIQISWSNVTSRSTGYEVYRSTSKNGTYKKIATVNNKSKSYTNNKTTSKKYYYYKVRAYKSIDSKNKVYSSYSSVKSIKSK